MSRPTGQIREGDRPFVGGLRTTEDEDDDTPLLSRPRRNFRASYMLTAFLSTLFTITDWERRDSKSKTEIKTNTNRLDNYITGT